MISSNSNALMRSSCSFHAKAKITSRTTPFSSSSRLSFAFSLVLLSLFAINFSDAILCEPLLEESWFGLLMALKQAEEGTGVVVVCPFTIQGDSCNPTKNTNDGSNSKSIYELKPRQQLYILCYSFYGGYDDRCIIDCPDKHFLVPSYARLELDRFTLKGSTSGPSIYVENDGELAIFNSIFQNNGHPNVNGGAIHATEYSIVTISNCQFHNNIAKNGGAIYTEAIHTEIFQSTFVKNKAASTVDGNGGGGAIYVGFRSALGLRNCIFDSNEATFLGPAILDKSNQHGTTVIMEENTGCNNQITTTNSVSSASASCNGKCIQQIGQGKINSIPDQSYTLCVTFENVCKNKKQLTEISNNNNNIPTVTVRSASEDDLGGNADSPSILSDRLGDEINSIVDVSSSKMMCSSNPSCYDLGLRGNCCPTTVGIMLDCC